MLAASQSHISESVEHFRKAIESNSSYAEAYLNLSLQLSLPGFCRGAPDCPAGAGLPILLQEPDDNSLLGTGFSGPCGCMVDVPNVTPGSLQITNPRKGNPDTLTNPYFNTALFSNEAIGRLGDANRRYFYGPGLNNWDLALLKDLRLTESKRLEFRAELFNAFNHVQFGLPQGNILNSSFGFVTSANAARIGQFAVKFYF
jgi:hypothetical protein